MNEHKAPGNEQAVESAALPMKNNTLGTTAMAPMKNNTLGTTITAPVKNNTLGTTAMAPVKSNKPGTSRPTSPVLAETMPAQKNQAYEPGGYMADYTQPAMQETGYYPHAMPQTGLMPSTSPQMGMYPSAMPQSSMVPSMIPQTGMAAPMTQRNMFQPAVPQGQGTMPMNGTQRTSIMTSGLGVRNSVLTSTDFTQGFLQTQIGRHVKVEFLIGTNMLVDREGDLAKVGTDYIIIQETETDDYLLCDIYSIRFIRFYY